MMVLEFLYGILRRSLRGFLFVCSQKHRTNKNADFGEVIRDNRMSMNGVEGRLYMVVTL